MSSPRWTPVDPSPAFFPVALEDVYRSSQGYKKLPRFMVLMDVKMERAFSVVTDEYDLVTNKQAWDMGAIVMQRVFHTLRMEDLACLNILMPKTRSFCHMDLIQLGTDFLPWEKDPWTAFLRVTNSYNRTRPLKFELGFCRSICMNGLIFGSKSIKYSRAHTRGGKETIEDFEDNIGDIRALEMQLTKSLQQLRRYHVPASEMLALVCKVFDIKAHRGDLENSKRRIKHVEIGTHVRDLTDRYFSESGPHAYAALNVLTDFATRPKGGLAPELAVHSHQHKAGNWMESFIEAIEDRDFSFESYLGEFRETAQIIEAA
ncbi:MAG: hypothetical protein RL173_106 [Fibrobacterota bacterium]|jgi:hypothetical protein